MRCTSVGAPRRRACRSGPPRIHEQQRLQASSSAFSQDYLTRLLPHTTTLLLHTCASSVCRRKGADMCIVWKPPLAWLLYCLPSERPLPPWYSTWQGG